MKKYVFILLVAFIIFTSITFSTSLAWESSGEGVINVEKIIKSPPATPELINPVNDDIFVSSTPEGELVIFSWTKTQNASKSELQISKDKDFSNVIIDVTVNTSTYSTRLTPGTYHWRVRAGNENGWSQWSTVWKFIVITLPEQPQKFYKLTPGSRLEFVFDRLKDELIGQSVLLFAEGIGGGLLTGGIWTFINVASTVYNWLVPKSNINIIKTYPYSYNITQLSSEVKNIYVEPGERIRIKAEISTGIFSGDVTFSINYHPLPYKYTSPYFGEQTIKVTGLERFKTYTIEFDEQFYYRGTYTITSSFWWCFFDTVTINVT